MHVQFLASIQGADSVPRLHAKKLVALKKKQNVPI